MPQTILQIPSATVAYSVGAILGGGGDSFSISLNNKSIGGADVPVAQVETATAAGTITARDAVTLRVSSFSPAFMEQVEQVAVTQMVMSGGDEALPMSADGSIDRASIPWGNFGAFLQKLLPIILELIKLFGL